MESGSESVLSSFKAALLERIKSPLAGAYIVSWLIVNWKIPYLLLWSDSTLTIGKRLNLINEKHLHNDYINLYVTPIIITLVYVVVFPYVVTLFKLLKKFHNDWDKKTEEAIFKNTLLTREESEKARMIIIQVNAENERLRGENVGLTESIDT